MLFKFCLRRYTEKELFIPAFMYCNYVVLFAAMFLLDCYYYSTKCNEQGCDPCTRKVDIVPYLLQANRKIPWLDGKYFRNLVSGLRLAFCLYKFLPYQNLGQLQLFIFSSITDFCFLSSFETFKLA